ncbi:tyrosine-type recombinase/integrase [Methanobacterium alcaliphilum]|uniref:tyrosine-type recombinase/integrase n=1 Tax=Methanobacterium alcaliphilum TaxID=392018 RepID=UPI00200ABD87|nr:site-specific integrase [Methanobacterium alcaliphilum]MCK9150501.1 site-specific integrase [Methanobacterium alcaliphilum]
MNFDGKDQQRIDFWVFNKDLEESTLKTYLNCLKKYCKTVGKSPNELIEEADAENDQGIRSRDRKINHYLLKFKKQLKSEGKARATIHLYIHAVKSFYDALDVETPKIKTPQGDITQEKNYGKLISLNEIKTLVNVAAPREKALIYLMALSGMAQAEARNLTIKKFMDAVGESLNREIESMKDLFEVEHSLDQEILTLHIVRKKVNHRYITFIPPEATIQIIYYLKERMYGRNQNIRITDINSPIFVKINGEPIDRDIIVTNFRRIGLEAGFKKEEGAYSFWRAHGLRKYFISTIMNKLGDKVLADYLVGHKLSGNDRAYWYPDEEDLKKRYLKALPYLSIDNAKVLEIKTEDYVRIERVERDQNKLKKKMSRTQMIVDVIEKNPKILAKLEEEFYKS